MTEKLTRYMTATQVCERYGGVSSMTLHRWLANPELRFPRPIRIGGLRLFDIHALDAYDQGRSESRAQA